MNYFKNIDLKDFTCNPFELVGKQWLLITAGDENKYNTMTASWGSFGVLWNKNIANIYVRPQRYTYDFIENSEYFTLSFLPEQHKDILTFCGRNSGKEVDKIKECGLETIHNNNGIYFEQSELVFICKKLYYTDINPNNFIDLELDKNYPNKDYHRHYVGEIVEVLAK